MLQITPELRRKYYGKVKEIAKECGYEGSLTPEALDECANAYLMCCDDEGTPKPRRYMRSVVNGKATNLNEIQWLLTHTQLFNRWFGASKVVDENGEPKVMYHGSAKVFKEFKPEAIKVKKSLMTLWSGPGFYFTDKKTIAEIYTKGEAEPMEMFVRLENPLVVDETGNAENGKGITKDAAIKIFLAGDNTDYFDRILPSELARLTGEPTIKFKNMSRQNRVKRFVGLLKTDVVMLKTCSQAYYKGSQKKMLDAICRYSGHDGVIHTLAPEIKEYIVYNPTAIKSATGNDGEFSRSSAVVMDEGNDLTEKKGANQMSSLIDVLKKIAAESAQGAKAEDVTDQHGHEHDANGRFTTKGASAAIPHDYGRRGKYRGRPTVGFNDTDDNTSTWYTDSASEYKEDKPEEMAPDAREFFDGYEDADFFMSDEKNGGDGRLYVRHNKGEPIYSYEKAEGLYEEEHPLSLEELMDDGGHASHFGEDGKEAAMDIVDRNGRHHERKGIPPGGQFENEAQYITTAKAAHEYYHKKFAHSDGAKKMREMCGDIISRIDSTKLGNDTIGHPYKMAIDGFKKMGKQQIVEGAHKAYEEMKHHAATYESIKGMGKDEFKAWVEKNPEYKSMEMENLLTNKAYNGKAKIKNAAGEYVEQDHEAWEEAKFMVARRAAASMLSYMAHIEALNNTPDEMIENYLKGKGESKKHTAGYSDYVKQHKIDHGSEEYDGNAAPTQSEINAVESELSKAFNTAKNAESEDEKSHATMVAHALSHFLGQDNGGMRNASTTKDALVDKLFKRVDAKKAAYEEALKSGNQEEELRAKHDHQATLLAARTVAHAIGHPKAMGSHMKDAQAFADAMGLKYNLGWEEPEGQGGKEDIAAKPQPTENNIATKPKVDEPKAIEQNEPPKKDYSGLKSKIDALFAGANGAALKGLMAKHKPEEGIEGHDIDTLVGKAKEHLNAAKTKGKGNPETQQHLAHYAHYMDAAHKKITAEA